MTAHYKGHGVTVYHGDSLDVLRELAPESVDAVITDPPYGLEFMGKEWDKFKGTPAAHADARTRRAAELDDPSKGKFIRAGVNAYEAGVPFQLWCTQWAAECLHVLKPGGHLLAFGGTRTWHRLACAIEDAGFEIRDTLAWMYGSGFPKSLDVSKAIDRAAGAERARYERPAFGGTFSDDNGTTYGTALVDQPATPDAERWQGWGTALKPAHEPIVLARKPLAGTVAATVLEHGTGALNIDACRVGMSEADRARIDGMGGFGRAGWSRADGTLGDIYEGAVDGSLAPINARAHDLGRWPANVVLDDTAAAMLDEQSGDGVSRIGKPRGADHGDGWGMTATGTEHSDSGGASRFFKVATTTPEDDLCLLRDLANTAAPTSSLPSRSDGSARDDAATSEHPGTPSHCPARSTNETLSASARCGASSTPTPSDGPKSSPDSPHEKHTQTPSPASSAEQATPTDITTTTANPSTSDGCADPVTSATTSTSSGPGALGSAPSRFIYTAKADAIERPRIDGTAHPTVKPLDLMRWLVRLVTPPGGLVLDPFAGSGTTAEACLVEGFRCVAVEREADYLPLIVSRVTRQRDPVAYVNLAGSETPTLFDDFAGGVA